MKPVEIIFVATIGFEVLLTIDVNKTCLAKNNKLYLLWVQDEIYRSILLKQI